VLRDINHHPIGMIKIIVPREIRMAGERTVFYFNVALIATGIIFAILLFYLLRFLVIKRLEKINNKIVKVIANNDFTLRVPQQGTDELSSVGAEMNKMLSTIASVEAVLADTINSMPSMLAIVDKKIHVTNLNSLAEKQLGIASEKAKGRSLFDFFPYLIPYKDKLIESIKNKLVQEINKISYVQNGNTHFLHAVLYPLSRSGEKTLAVRIDDVSERIKSDERLMQSDKLASIGILTAGVAYEINDPINFIFNAVDPMKKNIEIMLTLLKKYQGLNENEDFPNQLHAIEKFKTETNLAHIVQETNQLIQKVFDGADFTANIVLDLQAFSRLEEDVIKKTDIHQGIDSALVLLRHTYKNRIEVIKQYGKIEKIDCFPGRINQVFMNIILNAIDAISHKGKITICTEQIDSTVKISIKDTGVGIKKENDEKIFDPFFTTKDSKRTGLGLSISASIIRDHHGTIQINSEVEKGTDVVICLPINQSEP
jgi:PAS domain S-box-containing protein